MSCKIFIILYQDIRTRFAICCVSLCIDSLRFGQSYDRTIDEEGNQTHNWWTTTELCSRVASKSLPEPIKTMGLLPDTQNCGVRMCRECRERFPRHRGLAIPTCITCFPWSRRRRKHSRNSRRMHNQSFLWSSKSFTLPQPANHLFIKSTCYQHRNQPCMS